MFNKILPTLCLLLFPSAGLALQDSLILTNILGQQITAANGILNIFDKTSEHLKKAKEMHEKVEGVQDKAVRLHYYTQALAQFPKNRQQVKSLVEINENLQDANSLVLEGKSFAESAKLVDKAKVIQADILKSKLKKGALNDKELERITLNSAGAKFTGDGAIATARATTYSALVLRDINSGIDVLNTNLNVQNHLTTIQIREQLRNEYLMKSRWGMIPLMSFEEYLGGKTRAKKGKLR